MSPAATSLETQGGVANDCANDKTGDSNAANKESDAQFLGHLGTRLGILVSRLGLLNPRLALHSSQTDRQERWQTF